MKSADYALPADRAAMHHELCAIRRGQGYFETRLALLLARFEKERGFEAFGCATIREYCDRHLQLPGRQAMDLLRLGRRLPGLPTLRAALESGEVGLAKAREVLRVVAPETEEAWVEYASEATCRQVEHAVSARARRSGRDPWAPQERRGLCLGATCRPMGTSRSRRLGFG